MPIIAKKPEGGDFARVLAPAGLKPVVCCDVVDRGLVESTFAGETKTKHKVSIHFLLNDFIPPQWQHPHTSELVTPPDDLVGRPFGISEWFTLSLHEKSALRPFLGDWRGVALTEDECEEFDLERLIGVPGAANVVHKFNENKDQWYANIGSMSPLPKEWQSPIIPNDYVRIINRPPRDSAPQIQQPTAQAQPPFELAPNTAPLVNQGQISDPDDDLPF